MMIRRLIGLDLLLLRRSLLAWATIALLVLAAAASLAGGLDWRARVAAAPAATIEKVREGHAKLVSTFDGIAAGTAHPDDIRKLDPSKPYLPDPRDPYVEAFFNGRPAILPPGPLLGLATGDTEFHRGIHVITTRALDGFLRVGEPTERVNPAALANGRLDLLSFILLVCPLALIALLFDASARERESGIAALVTSMGATRRQLLATRGVTRGGIVLAVALLASLIGIVLVGASPTRGVLWCLGVATYLLFWLAVALAVASTRASAIGSAAVLATLWVVLTLILPGGIERAVRPSGLIEPRVIADADVRQIMRLHGEPAVLDRTRDLVGRRYWNIDFATASECARRPDVMKDFPIRRMMDESYARAMRAGQAREALFDRRLSAWGWLVPGLSFRRAMETVAGVDPARQRRFEASVINFHAKWRDRATAAVLACREVSRHDFDTAPAFGWREAPAGSGMIGFLVATLAAALALLAFAFRRGALWPDQAA